MNEKATPSPFDPEQLTQRNARQGIVRFAENLGLERGNPAEKQVRSIRDKNPGLGDLLSVVLDATDRGKKGKGLAKTGSINGIEYRDPRKYLEVASRELSSRLDAINQFFSRDDVRGTDFSAEDISFLQEQIILNPRFNRLDVLSVTRVVKDHGRINIEYSNGILYLYPPLSDQEFLDRFVNNNPRLSEMSQQYIRSLISSGELSDFYTYISDVYDENGRIVIASPETLRFLHPPLSEADFVARYVSNNDSLSDSAKARVVMLVNSGQIRELTTYISEVYEDKGRIVIKSPDGEGYY